MNTADLKVKEIEAALFKETPSEDFVAACEADARAGVQKLVKRYRRAQAERERLEALYVYEYAARDEGASYVAGVDEAGRGPLAGPVVVAAVILPFGLFLPGLNDSKKVSPNKREQLYDEILEKAVAVHVSIVDVATIDRVNIYQATMNGMYESILSLEPKPDKVLIDAVELAKLPMPSLSIIKGDAKSASIAAASIVAKVTRDRMMLKYDAEYPEYGFAQNKGYGTEQHIAALKQYGPCPIHRHSFEPVRSMAGLA
ncbi:MAG: ribonuclease HII [Schwartzia sp.]|nr:ribonuclease HII [Schwartzia sp. (in: firmicutes)]